MSGVLRVADRIGRGLETALLVVLLTGMMVLAAGQIVLRNAFDIGFIWGDELLRLMVLWLAMAGAMAAARSDKHISIALLDRYLAAGWLRAVKILINGFTALICGLTCYHSVQFVLTSHEYGDLLLGGVPAWWLQAILPAGFALLTWRYSLLSLSALVRRSDNARAP